MANNKQQTMNGLASTNATKVAARSQIPWAVKLIANGWGSLTTRQKQMARAANGVTAMINTAPKVAKLRGGARDASQQRTIRTAEKSHTLTKSEYLCDVIGKKGNTPTFRSWVINPSDPATFPQASVAAALYNKYRIADLKIRYSASSSFETNGKVAIAFNQDASDPVPTSKVEMYELAKHMETQPQCNALMAVPHDSKVRFLRDSASDDPKLVDSGRVILTTYGFDSDDLLCGELFIEYTLVLQEPNYTARISQMGTSLTVTGPAFASVVNSGTQFTLNLRVAGSFYVVLRAANGQMSRPTFGSTDIEGSILLTNDTDAALCCMEVKAKVPGTSILATTIAPGVVDWRVFRL